MPFIFEWQKRTYDKKLYNSIMIDIISCKYLHPSPPTRLADGLGVEGLLP